MPQIPVPLPSPVAAWHAIVGGGSGSDSPEPGSTGGGTTMGGLTLDRDKFAQWPSPVQSYYRDAAAEAQKQTPNIHQAENSGKPATATQDEDKLASREKQGVVALATGLGVQMLGNFKSYALDRGRLGVAAMQEMRGGQARWAPLLLGVGGGTAMTAYGLYNLKQVTKDGFSNVFSTEGALAVGEAGAGAGMIAFGAHKGLPGGLNLIKDIFRGPTTSSVPATGGTLGPWTANILGKSRTFEVTNMWGKTLRASSVIGTGMGVLTAVAAGASLIDGYTNDGQNSPVGFLNTKSGRAGLIYGAMAIEGFSFSTYAGLRGVKEGQKFMDAFTGSEWLMKPSVRNVKWGLGLALGGMWALNQFTDVFKGMNNLGGSDTK